jgi:septum formation protein
LRASPAPILQALYNPTPMPLILASASPRRQQLLHHAGFEFEVRHSSIREEPRPGEAPKEFVRRMAAEKALEVAAGSPEGVLVLGADTVVVADAEILNKPADPADAARMLRRLSGRSHWVITGVCLVKASCTVEAQDESETRVWFRPLEEAEIREYAASGEPLDKAGAYGIQGRASRFVTRIEGCYFNAVGLPVSLVDQMLRPFLRNR